MALVRFDSTAFSRMHDENFRSGQDDKTKSRSTELSERLQTLLERAREANAATEHRESLEDFLGRLEQERKEGAEAREKQIKVSVSAFLRTVESNNRLDGTPVSHATQTEPVPEHVEKLLTKCRHEAYELGYMAGKAHERREKEGRVKGGEIKGEDPFQSLLGLAARK